MQKTNPNLAIIGAGLSGILSAHQALSDNYSNIVIFERKNTLGGIWAPDGLAWPGLICNISKYTMNFPFFQFLGTDELYPRTETVFRHLDEMADTLKIKNLIKFGTKVTLISQNPDSSLTIHWTDENEEKKQQKFDQVVVAVGKMGKMDFGPFEKYLNKQNGCTLEIMHAGEYRNTERFKNKRVLVVGSGHSATQLSSEISKVSSELTNVFRKRSVILSRMIYSEKYKKVLPGEYVFGLTRAVRKQRENLSVNDILKAFNNFLVKNSKQNEIGIHPDLFIPNDFDQKLRVAIADDYLNDVKAGKFKIINSEIKEIVGSNVILANGQTLEVDILLVGIGYMVNYDYLDEKIQKILDYNPLNRIRPLDLDLSYVYNRKLKNMAFIGTQPAPTQWASNFLQVMVAFQYLKNQDNYDEIYKRLDEYKSNVNYNDMTGYLDLMAKEIGWMPNLAFIEKNDKELFDYVMNGPYLIQHFSLQEKYYGTQIWERNANFIKHFNRDLREEREIKYD